MDNSKGNTVLGTGLTFMQVLFIVFLILKLTGTTAVATWSWWWVTVPLWGGAALVLGIWGIVFFFIGLAMLFKLIWYVIRY
jgi:hypothetical protein